MSPHPIRILGLATESVSDFRQRPTAKNAGLFAALDRRFGVVGMVHPTLSRLDDLLNKLRSVHLNRTYWSTRTRVNLWALRRRIAIAERQLRDWDGRYDLIMQLHCLVGPGDPAAGRRYIMHTDNTYALTERNYSPWATLRSRREREAWLEFERQTYQQAAYLFPRSEYVRRSLIEDYGCDPQRVMAVGGGANLVAGSLDGKRYDTKIALFVGRNFRRKGGPAVLRAWELVRRRLPDAQLWIVGPDRPRRSTGAGVRWFGRVTDRRVLADLYTQAAVFVMPSIFEPWGQVFHEAMGHGLPCIGADCCAMPEIIQAGVTGALVPAGEAEPLARQLLALLGDPARAEAMGRRAYAQVQQGHTWDDVVERMAPYIEQTVEQRR